MNEALSQQQEKQRLSCEGCRRKKTKCPAERPVCSVCQRLNQQCIYLQRHRTSANRRLSRVSKSGVDADRFDRLESQVSGLFEFLRQSPTTTILPNSGGSGSNTSSFTLRPTLPPASSQFSSASPIPPLHVLERCVRVYRTKIHAQPLQLFGIQGLLQYVAGSPRYLLWSFLALTLNLCSHDFFQGQEMDAIAFYASAAHQSVQELARQGIAKPEMVQALCLLALSEVAAGTPAKAWMTMGIVGRVEALRSIISPASTHGSNDAERQSSYSLFVLERTFSPRTLHPTQSENLPQLPQSPQYPLPPIQALTPTGPPQQSSSGSSDDGSGAEFEAPEQNSSDFDINAACMRSIAAWGNLMSYLYEIQAGKSDNCWAPTSTHANLYAQLCACDVHLSNNHLLRHVHFSRRAPAEIEGHREYWSTWILTQIALHGAQAVLNHPFIHLIVLRDRKDVIQSRVFQQQTVDQALFHSGWVARLIRSCEDVQLEINDPLIGNIVAAVATIPWIFQFARDRKVVQQTRTDTQTFERLLNHLSTMWPQFNGKLQLLRDLEALSEVEPGGTPGSSINVTFKPLLVWKLLDSDLSQYIQSSSASEHDDVTATSPDTSIRVTTKIVHPLAAKRNERSDRRSHASNEVEAGANVSQDSAYDRYMIEHFMQLDPDDFQWIDPHLTPL